MVYVPKHDQTVWLSNKELKNNINHVAHGMHNITWSGI